MLPVFNRLTTINIQECVEIAWTWIELEQVFLVVKIGLRSVTWTDQPYTWINII